jgi:hypothetical protein
MIMDDSLRAVRRALIIFLAAVLVSVLAALTMIGSAALTRSLALVSDRRSVGCGPGVVDPRFSHLRRDRQAQRRVIGPLGGTGLRGGHQPDLALSGYWRRTPRSRCRALSGWTCRTDPGWRSMSPGRQAASSAADHLRPWRTGRSRHGA